MHVVSDPRKIERVPLTHVDNMEAELRGKVLDEANRRFGYKADAFNTIGPLAKVLLELDIIPFKTEEVRAYMATKVKTYVRDWKPLVHTLVTCVVIAAGVAVALHLFQLSATVSDFQESHYISGLGDTHSPEWFIILFPAIMGTGLVCAIANGIAGAFMTSFPKRLITYEWKRFNLGKDKPRYDRYVPVHVLNIANQIASRCPEATFEIDELAMTEQQIARPLPDPFLRVTWNAEFFYVAVWDEKEFEAKM